MSEIASIDREGSLRSFQDREPEALVEAYYWQKQYLFSKKQSIKVTGSFTPQLMAKNQVLPWRVYTKFILKKDQKKDAEAEYNTTTLVSNLRSLHGENRLRTSKWDSNPQPRDDCCLFHRSLARYHCA